MHPPFLLFQPPFQIPPVGGAPAGPPISTRDGRAYPHTRGGRTHVGSSSRALVSDDESEAETEAEETGDGSDSSSGGDAPGGAPVDDAPGPSSRKRTRTD